VVKIDDIITLASTFGKKEESSTSDWWVRGLPQRPNLTEGPATSRDSRRSITEEEEDMYVTLAPGQALLNVQRRQAVIAKDFSKMFPRNFFWIFPFKRIYPNFCFRVDDILMSDPTNFHWSV
jgi:hypothetical protein